MKKRCLLLSMLVLTSCYPVRSQKFSLPPTPTDLQREAIGIELAPVEKDIPAFRVSWQAPDAALASIRIGYMASSEFFSTEIAFPPYEDPMADPAPQDHVLTTPEGHLAVDVWVGHSAVELCFTTTSSTECHITDPLSDAALWADSDNAPLPILTPEEAANYLWFQFTGFCMTGQYAYYCTGYSWSVVDPLQVWVARGRVFLGQFYANHSDETAAEGTISVRHNLSDRAVRLCALNPAGQPGMLCALCTIMSDSQTCIPA